MKNKKNMIELTLVKQKSPANYFWINVFIVIFVYFNWTTLIS